MMIQGIERRATTTDVCEVIAAAGSLTAEDIAGWLNVSAYEASEQVAVLSRRRLVCEDEFGRYRLLADCSLAAAA
jgi:hypothetical protein